MVFLFFILMKNNVDLEEGTHYNEYVYCMISYKYYNGLCLSHIHHHYRRHCHRRIHS